MNKLEVVLLSHFVKLADNRYRVAAVLATVVSVKIPGVNAKTIAPYDYYSCILGNMYLPKDDLERFQCMRISSPLVLPLHSVFLVFQQVCCQNSSSCSQDGIAGNELEYQAQAHHIRICKSFLAAQVIAHLWHYKVCDLDMDLCLVSDFFECLENGVGTWYAYVSSDKLLLTASLKVDCDAVKELTHHINRFRSIIAI